LTPVSPARAVAFAVVRRVFEDGAYADRALHAETARTTLSPRDRALATQLAYGTVQRRRTLDHLLAPLSSRPLHELDPPVLAALRLGVFQLAFTGGIAEHAAVNESVELVKATRSHGSKTVNAVLRRAAREARPRLSELNGDTPQSAAILHSVPDWIVELWWRELGAEEARALLSTVNQPAEAALRINPLRARTEPRLPVAHHCAPDPELPEARILDAPFDAFGSTLWQEGLIMPQSRASMLVARRLAPAPGERVLDLCAAPGAKTTHLAALMGDEGELDAVEVNPARARELAATCARMGAASVRVHAQDGREPAPHPPYDRVLVDPPCSGLGTLQARPDLRWQRRRAELDELVAKQAELLGAAGRALRRGGTLVYSVCTISAAESEGVLDAFTTAHPDFEIAERSLLLPHRHGSDGFFIARLHRR
jgi:16S rRNA (cytosine967-C5)-methyltransferase